MKRITSYFRFALVAFLILYPVLSGIASPMEEYPGVVATTSWTAAFAIAAGATEVHVLAPYEMRHPPEYELSPSDIAVVTNARYVVFAGYEGSVPRIKAAIGDGGPELVQIATDFSPDTISASISEIADILGTRSVGDASIREILGFYDEWRKEIEAAGINDVGVIAHSFQRPLVEAIGGTVLGTFGPAPLEARQIADLSKLPAGLIVDNFHNDVGKPLRETMVSTGKGDGPTSGVRVVEFINFPGTAGTITLMDVLRENRRRLRAVIGTE